LEQFLSPYEDGDCITTAEKVYNSDKELEIHVLVGNKPFPVFPTRSGAEQLYQLKKSLGIHGSNFHSISIDKLHEIFV
jgi:hypothetical protein